jgi:hypothetical protein
MYIIYASKRQALQSNSSRGHFSPTPFLDQHNYLLLLLFIFVKCLFVVLQCAACTSVIYIYIYIYIYLIYTIPSVHFIHAYLFFLVSYTLYLLQPTTLFSPSFLLSWKTLSILVVLIFSLPYPTLSICPSVVSIRHICPWCLSIMSVCRVYSFVVSVCLFVCLSVVSNHISLLAKQYK